ncbi:MAG: hypothetical protein HYR96_09550 [Deltaproteobacteria bacterium]|nr:hypothetical protein [Deltaproteobacteria bacterium]
MNKLNFIAMALILAASAQAKQYPQLTDFINNTAHDVNLALVTTAHGSTQTGVMPAMSGFEFRRIFLRLQANVGFAIEVAKIELIPELELVFQGDPRPKP